MPYALVGMPVTAAAGGCGIALWYGGSLARLDASDDQVSAPQTCCNAG